MPPSRDPLKDLVKQYRAAIDPPPEHVERERERLLARLAAAPPAGASPPPRSRRLALAAALVAGVVLVLVGLRVYIDLRIQQTLDASLAVQQAPAPPAQPTHPIAAPRGPIERTPDPLPPAAPKPLEPVARPMDAPFAPESPPVVIAPTASRRGLAPADDADALLRESALLSRAREAQARGEWLRVLELVDQHARVYPRGLLLEERLVLEAGAACNADQRERGRKALQSLARRFPRSLALARVRDMCERPGDE